MKQKETAKPVTIDNNNVLLRLGEAESIVIPRRSLRTRLQLLEWVYRLTSWPGMNPHRLRTFIASMCGHHGWELPDPAMLRQSRSQ